MQLKFPALTPWNCAQVGVALLVLWPAVGAGILVLLTLWLWEKQVRVLLQDPWLWGWLGLGIWLLVSSSWAAFPNEAILGAANFLPFWLLFAAISGLVNRPEQWQRLAWLVVSSALPVVIFALLGLAGLETPDWWSSILGWGLVPGGEPAGRLSGVFIYANFLGMYLLIVGNLAIALLVAGCRGHSSLARGKIGFLGVTVGFIGLGILLTDSRNAWGIAFLTGLAWIVYLGWRWLALASLSAAAAVAWASFGPMAGQGIIRQIIPRFLWGRLADHDFPERADATLRVNLWDFALTKIQERPLQGWGLRNFTPLYLEKTDVWMGHPHNLYLMLAMESGLIAVMVFIALIGIALFKAMRRWRVWQEQNPQTGAIILGYLLAFASCLLFNLLDVTIFDLRVNTLTWIVFGVLLSVGRAPLIPEIQPADEGSYVHQ
ncbi:MAG: O-antigen ligase family protein [Cyanobacteria bacterium P01_H01_bin.15]